MTIIVFLVDTSASMQQKAFVSGRSTLLDVAKGAVEFFVKMRQKSNESRGDRYMLLTFEEYPKNIKAGWKENLQTFMNELKNLEACGMTTMGTALKQVFDILNINRMQTGIDMYGQGRYPFYLEPAVIIVISDGGKLTTQGSVQGELILPMHSSVPGYELTREPFRWDQRLYALVLRMAGTPPMSQETGHVASDYSPIDMMCEVTGGRSYAVTSQRVLHQCIDSLVQKLQSGVIIHFEKVGPDPAPVRDGENTPDEDVIPLTRADTIPLDELKDDDVLSVKGLNFNKELNGGCGSNPSRPHTPNPILAPSNTAWHNCRRLIFVPRSAQKGFAVGFWPLPEAFWPDVNSPALPQRSAHPNVKFSCTNLEPMIIDNLPFDKYELEPSPLTQYLLARKQPKVCWQVYIHGSSKSMSSDPVPPVHPFGYLKASTNLMTVNLFVLPYNYPVLLPLLDELFKVHRLKPSNDWRNGFHGYIRSMPAYYAGPLRRVLTRMGAGNLANSLIPETMDNFLSYSVLNYLKRLKNQAKIDYDKILNSTPVSKTRMGPEGIKVIPKSPFKKELLTNHLLKDKFNPLRDQLTDFPGFLLGIRESGLKVDRYRNPFDIPRNVLLDQIVRMRANFLQPSILNTKLVDDDSKHSLPIGQMGNYQDYLKKMPVPLREIESTPVRQHMFGNPFKINKNMIMDEVVMDEVSLAGQSGFGSTGQPVRGVKRQAESQLNNAPTTKRQRKGPLPRDFVYRRTPPGTPVHFSSMYDVPVLSPLPSLHLSPIISNHDFENNLPTGPPMSPLPTPPMSPSNGSSMNNSYSPTNSMMNGTATYSEPAESSSDSDDDEVLVVPRLGPEPVADIPEIINSHHLQDSPPPDFLNSELLHQPFRGRERSPSPKLPSVVISNSLPQIPQTTGNGFPTHPEFPVSEPLRTNVVQPLPVEHLVKVEDVKNNCVLNGRRTSRDKSPAPPTIIPTVPIKQELPLKQEPVVEPSLSKEELRCVFIRNQNMRHMIFKEVKRPGKDHGKLFEMLRDLHGPPSVRRSYICDVISEARRFKRETLVDKLEQAMDDLISVS